MLFVWPFVACSGSGSLARVTPLIVGGLDLGDVFSFAI